MSNNHNECSLWQSISTGTKYFFSNLASLGTGDMLLVKEINDTKSNVKAMVRNMHYLIDQYQELSDSFSEELGELKNKMDLESTCHCKNVEYEKTKLSDKIEALQERLALFISNIDDRLSLIEEVLANEIYKDLVPDEEDDSEIFKKEEVIEPPKPKRRSRTKKES